MTTLYKENYILHLADNALILSQRQSAWCGHGPILEQDIAITNISLDLLGQARNFYQYAATIIGNTDEDKLAYLRTEREFKNCILPELPNGDWAQTILKLYFFSEFQFLCFKELIKSSDSQLAAIAEKSIKETTYHVRWSREWVIRLGDGTEESKQRMLHAIDTLWKYTQELFIPADYETEALHHNIGVDIKALQEIWLQNINACFAEATLPHNLVHTKTWSGLNGKQGIHTEQMGYILTELQYVQRAYPNSEW
jgi:ring-1,2-phenylacetyl-CoA epoxidase subunit PaaC